MRRRERQKPGAEPEEPEQLEEEAEGADDSLVELTPPSADTGAKGKYVSPSELPRSTEDLTLTSMNVHTR